MGEGTGSQGGSGGKWGRVWGSGVWGRARGVEEAEAATLVRGGGL